MNVATDELRISIGMPHAFEFDDCFLHHVKADVRVRHFATAELQPELHLVAVIEEIFGVTQLRIEIALGNACAELDLLDLARGRFRVRVLLLLLVHVLAKIHDPANRWCGIRRDFDEVEANFKREIDGFRSIEDAELLALGRDHAHLWNLDAVIAADGREWVDIATLIRARAGAAPGGRKRIGHQLGWVIW